MNNKLNNYFFAFDSDCFDEIKSKVYGYTICKKSGNIKISNDTNGVIGGCYIMFERENDTVKIKQDDLSSQYIYYYNDGKYWAVGNSFYNLCSLLKSKGKKLTVRNLYIDQYIHQNLHVYACGRTMVDEIYVLSPFSEILLTQNSFTITKKDTEFETIDLESEEGMAIIDRWIDKWCSIMKAIYDSGTNIQIDLSGGFDSRTIFSLANHAGINFNAETVNVYSKIGNTKGMIDHLDNDYEIAEQISERLNFMLNLHNDMFKSNKASNKGDTQYEILRNLFMFTHKEGYLCTGVRYTPMVHFGGINGELIRRKLGGFTNYRSRCFNDPFRQSQDVIDAFISDLEKIEEKSKTRFERDAKFYLETQNKSHYGACIYNDLLANIFLISPFNDRSLLKLKIRDSIDPNIIFAIIIYRTAPQIFDIDFSSNRKFDDNVKKLTIELCKKYPKRKMVYDYSCEFDYNIVKPIDNGNDGKNGEHVMYEVFSENKKRFVNYINKVWGEKYANDIYEYADKFYLNKDNFYPNKWVTTLTSVIELLKLLGYE